MCIKFPFCAIFLNKSPYYHTQDACKEESRLASRLKQIKEIKGFK